MVLHGVIPLLLVQGRCQGTNKEFFSVPSFSILVSEKSETGASEFCENRRGVVQDTHDKVLSGMFLVEFV